MIVEDKAAAPVHQKAGAVQNEKGGEDLVQFVTCRIAQEEFALDVLSVQEINRMVEVTRVPKAPYFVEGVINLRGRIIPVLDHAHVFGVGVDAEADEGISFCYLIK